MVQRPLQIPSSAKGFAPAGYDHCPHLVITCQDGQLIGQLGDHIIVEGIEGFRPVQGNLGYIVMLGQLD
jgi:hypothetical protein